MDADSLLLTAAALLQIGRAAIVLRKKKRQRRNRNMWSRNWLQRRDHGRGVLHMLNDELLTEDNLAYTNYLRMRNEEFEILLKGIETTIMKQDTNMRCSISPKNRLQLTLRFLATGESYRSLMYATRIHETTISRIVPEVCEAIYNFLKKDYLTTPNTADEWKEVADNFWNLWQFPNCLGAIDGRHIKFTPPRSDGSYYFNYKGDHSIVLLAMVDAKYRFTYVNIGCNGRISDGGVFRECQLSKCFENNLLNFPSPQSLPNRTMKIPYVIVADDAFPLSTNVMKPYPNRGLSHDERIFNYRLSRARRIVENGFGILSNKFRVLLNPIHLRVCKVVGITLACVSLHNFIIAHNEVRGTEVVIDEVDVKLPSISAQGGNKSSNGARSIREEFKNFFNTVGAVAWQEEAILKHNL